MAFERPVLANPDPRVQAFVDQSCDLLEEMEADFLATVGQPFDGHAAVFAAIELLALAAETRWALCEPWLMELGYEVIREQDGEANPEGLFAFMVHLCPFIVFLGKKGLVSPRTDAAWRVRLGELLAERDRRRAGLPPEAPAWVTTAMQTSPVHTEEVRGPSGEVLFSFDVRPLALDELDAFGAPPLNRAQRRALRPSSKAHRRSRPS